MTIKARLWMTSGKFIQWCLWSVLIALFPFRVLAFDYFEHRYLGNQAYDAATRNRTSWDETFQKHLKKAEDCLGLMDTKDKYDSNNYDFEACNDKNASASLIPTVAALFSEHNKQAVEEMLASIPIMFGDLSALAGDHVDIVAGEATDSKDLQNMVVMIQAFADPFHKSGEHQRILATRRHWIHACRWYRQSIGGPESFRQLLNTCFNTTSGSGTLYRRSEPGATTGYSPSRLELAEFERLPKYVGLAGSNKNHFPMHSWKTYIDHHMAALKKAVEYASGREDEEFAPDSDDELVRLLKEALIHEGIAQHFLQDSFAAGHISSPYGHCLHIPGLNYVPVLDFELFCTPSKRELQHGHDYVNELGVIVSNSQDGEPPGGQSVDGLKTATHDRLQKRSRTWRAFGDRHLFIPEAGKHRSILKDRTMKSLQQILRAAQKLEPPLTRRDICEQWLPAFPIPETGPRNEWSVMECSNEDSPTRDLSVWEKGRSSDPQVPDLPLEGWKFRVTVGNLWGTFTHLNEDGSSRAPRSSVNALTFDLGYVRPTDWWKPNYVGSGMVIAPGNRLSIYPASIGYWHDACGWFSKGFCFAGIRTNAGVRLTEPFSVENRSTHRNDIFEVNVPFDFGLMVYPPVALYFRADFLTIGCPVPSDPHSWEIDSIFVGRGAITGGISFDLAGILP